MGEEEGDGLRPDGPGATGTYLYWIADKENKAICAEAKTGKVMWEERLPGSKSGDRQPGADDGKVYSVNEDGRVAVFEAEPKFNLLAENDLKEDVYRLTGGGRWAALHPRGEPPVLHREEVSRGTIDEPGLRGRFDRRSRFRLSPSTSCRFASAAAGPSRRGRQKLMFASLIPATATPITFPFTSTTGPPELPNVIPPST